MAETPEAKPLQDSQLLQQLQQTIEGVLAEGKPSDGFTENSLLKSRPSLNVRLMLRQLSPYLEDYPWLATDHEAVRKIDTVLEMAYPIERPTRRATGGVYGYISPEEEQWIQQQVAWRAQRIQDILENHSVQ